MKGVDLRYHFIWEAVPEGKITVGYVPTDKNELDIFTEALRKPKYQRFFQLLGLRDENKGERKKLKTRELSVWRGL